MGFKPQVTAHERKLMAALQYRHIECISNPRVCGYYPDIQVVGTNILIEVDGAVHWGKVARSRDRERTKHLNLQGYRVIRVRNCQIEDNQKLRLVVAQIEQAIERSRSGRSGLVFREGGGVDPTSAKRARRKAKALNGKPQRRRKSVK